MRVTSLLKFALLAVVSLAASTCLWAQLTTPTIDGYIAPGEYGANNQLNNAGNTGQTWYMTWDANNLYVGIVNANLSEGAVLYIKGNPQNPVTCCSNGDGNSSGFNYDNADFSPCRFGPPSSPISRTAIANTATRTDVGNWGGANSYYGQYAGQWQQSKHP